jgi:hypothetical protein
MNTEGFLQWVPDEADWERMQRLGDASNRMDLSLDYAGFRAWNRACFEALRGHELAFVVQLLTSMSGERVRLLDMETCASLPANLVMFDQHKALVIVRNR